MSKKNALEFDRSQPAFLRRLQGEISGQLDDPDRQVNPVARPQRPKRLDAEEDDGPTYVMEDTNESLTKDEYEALVKNEANASESAQGEMQDAVLEKSKSTQKVAAIGAAKKRKAAKIIGNDENDENDDEDKQDEKAKTVGKKSATTKKKKAKVTIKFGDDEET